MPERLEITGPAADRYDEILTPRALDLLAALHDELGRAAGGTARGAAPARQAELSGGAMLDFLPATGAHPRRHDLAGRSPAPGLVDRRVEITGPTDKKMTINALNSGANVWLADFEDANTPLWSNMIEGQLNLRDALDRTIDFTSRGGQDIRAAARRRTGHDRGPAARLAPGGEAHPHRRPPGDRAASPTSRSTWWPRRESSSTRARAPTSTWRRWSPTSRRGCGTTRSTSRRTSCPSRGARSAPRC